MSLGQKLQEDLKQAMKQRDEIRRSVVRMVLAAQKYAEVDSGRALTDDEILRVIEKQAKMRRESIAEFAKGNRPDLVAKEQAELQVLLTYLPQQMSRDAVEVIARRVIDEVGATQPSDIGKVMPKIMGEVRGRADGRLVNQIVQELLGKR